MPIDQELLVLNNNPLKVCRCLSFCSQKLHFYFHWKQKQMLMSFGLEIKLNEMKKYLNSFQATKKKMYTNLFGVFCTMCVHSRQLFETKKEWFKHFFGIFSFTGNIYYTNKNFYILFKIPIQFLCLLYGYYVFYMPFFFKLIHFSCRQNQHIYLENLTRYDHYVE